MLLDKNVSATDQLFISGYTALAEGLCNVLLCFCVIPHFTSFLFQPWLIPKYSRIRRDTNGLGILMQMDNSRGKLGKT